jgi:isoleucyl-tRNA synthetase
MQEFVDDLSNWYVRRSRRRFWKSENDADKLSAYNTLYNCLVTVAKLLAPFTPFVAEELYRNLMCSVVKDAPESVHLIDFPVADESKIDRDLSDYTRIAMRISSQGRATRANKGIKVRQPMATVFVIDSTENKRALESNTIKQSVMDELNVKDIRFATTEQLAAMATNPDYAVDNVQVASTAMYTKDIPKELLAEGMAREIVHRLQTMRRSAGFEIADYITTFYQGDEYVRQVMTDFADYLKQETLSRQLVEGATAEGAFIETHKLAGHSIVLGVKKLN